MRFSTKKILKHPYIRPLLHLLGGTATGLYLALVALTSRKTIVNRQAPQQFWQNGQPVILAFWHGRLLFVPQLKPTFKKGTIMVSQHGDGQMIAHTTRLVGLHPAMGSAKKGSTSAFRSMLRAAKAGCNLLITPDAPPHPRYTCLPGVIELARLTNLPIIPCSASTTNGKQLAKTKDHLVIPKPFTHHHIHYGEPIFVKNKNESETATNTLQTQLLTLTQAADKTAGNPNWSPPLAPSVKNA